MGAEHVTQIPTRGEAVQENTFTDTNLNAALLGWMQDLSPNGIFTTDTQLRVTSWNKWLEHHSKRKAEQVIGKPLAEVIPSLRERRLDHYYRDALNGESKVLSRSLHGYLLPLPPTLPSTLFMFMQQNTLIAPLVLAGEVYGTITVIEDVTDREWQQAVLRQARQRSELLGTTLARLISMRDPTQLVQDLFSQIAPALRLDACIHHIIEPNLQKIQLYSASGVDECENTKCAVLELGQGLCGTIAQTRERLVVNNLQNRHEGNMAACQNFGYRVFAGFPLLVGNRLLGSLAFVSRTRDSFSDDELNFLFSIAQYAAIALDRAHQEEKLRASEERFRNMAETVPDIIFTSVADGSRDFVSPRFYAVTGLKPDEGLGFGWMRALHPDDLEAVHLAWQRSVQTLQPYNMEYRLRDAHGQYRWFYARAHAIGDATRQVTKWFGSVTDIELIKVSQLELAHAQVKLASHAAELEQTIEQRTAELRETITHLESFSYTVAHDLRAPIRTIEGYANIVLEDCGHQLNEQARDLLRNMARSARRLDALTKDVLDYTKVTTQKVDLAPTDPTDILQDIISMDPELQLPKAKVAVVGPLPPVLGNVTLLSQCFSNLLSNAVKFVNPGVTPHVMVRSESHSRSNGELPRVRFWFEDNGIGMDAETQRKIFGIFERSRGVSKFPGTGIGLAILAKAVERMQGSYGVESEFGKGSRFWIELTAA